MKWHKLIWYVLPENGARWRIEWCIRSMDVAWWQRKDKFSETIETNHFPALIGTDCHNRNLKLLPVLPIYLCAQNCHMLTFWQVSVARKSLTSIRFSWDFDDHLSLECFRPVTWRFNKVQGTLRHVQRWVDQVLTAIHCHEVLCLTARVGGSTQSKRLTRPSHFKFLFINHRSTGSSTTGPIPPVRHWWRQLTPASVVEQACIEPPHKSPSNVFERFFPLKN